MCTPRGAWILTGCGLEAPGAGPGGGQGRGPYNFEQKRRKRGKIKLFAKVKYFAWKANPFSTDWSQRSCYTHTHAHTHTHTHKACCVRPRARHRRFRPRAHKGVATQSNASIIDARQPHVNHALTLGVATQGCVNF